MAATKVVALLLLFAAVYGEHCPAGSTYGSDFNKCYQYFPEATNWLAAEMNCKQLGGSLVYIQNGYENGYIARLVAANSSSPDYWIGANLLMASQWTWTNGNNVTYFDWSSKQPTDSDVYQCAAATSQLSSWTKELCRSQKSYVCQIYPNYVPSECGTTVGCPNGQMLHTCKCYKYLSVSSDYWSGDYICRTMYNATLAVILNDDENNFAAQVVLQSAPPRNGLKNPWIGLTCSPNQQYHAPNEVCRWIDGTPVNYTRFEYNYVPAYGYVVMDPGDGPYHTTFWYSIDTQNMQPSICQQGGIP